MLRARSGLCLLTWVALACQQGHGGPSAPAPSAAGPAMTSGPAPAGAALALPSAPSTATTVSVSPSLPPKLLGPAESDDDPKVQADTAGVCAQLHHGRFGAFNQLATFTRRWGQLAFLYARGDRQAACDIAGLVRRAAAQPGSACNVEDVKRFELGCNPPP